RLFLSPEARPFRAVWRELPVITIAFPSGGLVLRNLAAGGDSVSEGRNCVRETRPVVQKMPTTGLRMFDPYRPCRVGYTCTRDDPPCEALEARVKDMLKQTAHCFIQPQSRLLKEVFKSISVDGLNARRNGDLQSGCADTGFETDSAYDVF